MTYLWQVLHENQLKQNIKMKIFHKLSESMSAYDKPTRTQPIHRDTLLSRKKENQ